MPVVVRLLSWLWKNILWAALVGAFELLWKVVSAIIGPAAKGIGKMIEKNALFLGCAAVVVGSIFVLLHAPKQTQDQGAALIALFVFCTMAWFAFRSPP